MNINAALRRDGYMVPLVADVHFNPKVADVAAQYAEKVRINPGNYVDAARTFKHLEYTDEEYAVDIELYALCGESDKPVFNVSIEYRLEGDDLVVTVPMSEIEYKDEYPIISLTILP